MDKSDYVEIMDINNRVVKVKDNLNLYYRDESDNKLYSLRVELEKNYHSDIDEYMEGNCYMIGLDIFNDYQKDMMIDDDFEGTFVYKLFGNHRVYTHYFTFFGFEDENIFVMPYKFDRENMCTVDPTTIISKEWYYIPAYDDEE